MSLHNDETKIMSDTDALERVRKDIILLIHKQPFYAYLLVKTKRVIDKRVPVAGVSVIDGMITLYINPEGYLSYTKEERIFILIHEIMHVIWIHYLRKNKRDHSLWNVATDIAINQLIETDYAYMPIDCLRPDHYNLPEKENAEFYYKTLWQRNEPLHIPPDLLKGALGQKLRDSACSSCDGTGQHKSDNNTEEGIIQEIDYHNNDLKVNDEWFSSSSDTSITSEDGRPMSFPDLEKAMVVIIEFNDINTQKYTNSIVVKIHKASTKEEQDEKSNTNDNENKNNQEINNPWDSNDEHKEDNKCPQCNGSGQDNKNHQPKNGKGESLAPSFSDLHPTWEESSDVSEQLAEGMVRSLIKDAKDKANGKLPGAIKEIINEILDSKTDWRSIFRNFYAKKRNLDKKSTWKKRNRRLGSNVMGHRRNRKLQVCIIFDTSGSISDNDLALFTGEMIQMHRSGADIVVIEADAKVQNVYEFDGKLQPEFKGRYGTDFRPAFAHIKEKKHKLLRRNFDAIIYLTDGFGSAPDSFHIPTLWCLTSKGRIPSGDSFNEPIDWGTIIKIQD